MTHLPGGGVNWLEAAGAPEVIMVPGERVEVTPISEMEWLRGAQEQAEEWFASALVGAREAVKAARMRWENALDEFAALFLRRAKMREDFALRWELHE